MNQLFAAHAELEREMLSQAQREALHGERGALRRGLISDEVFGELRADVDRRLEALALIYAAFQQSVSNHGQENEK